MRHRTFTIEQKKVLILLANPIGTTQLRLDEEVRDIKEGLQRSKYRDRFDVNHQWAVRLRDLRRALFDHEPQLLHFSGHGDIEGLLVEDEQGFAVLVPPDALTDLFKLHSKRIECVILSACYSDFQAKAINKHIRYVIGMPREIKDKAALEFVVGFYDAMGAGKSVSEAHDFGRNAIMQYWPEIPEQIHPQLHFNRKVKVRRKRYYVTRFILVIFLLVGFWAGLQWKDDSKRTAAPVKKPARTVTIDTPAAAPPRAAVSPPSEEERPEIENLVYTTRTGRKYHKEHCSHLRTSRIPMSLIKAQESGYAPCSRCFPPD